MIWVVLFLLHSSRNSQCVDGDLCCQVVVMEMQRGDQVYLELTSGRKLCTFMEYNIFTGHIVYPYTE